MFHKHIDPDIPKKNFSSQLDETCYVTRWQGADYARLFFSPSHENFGFYMYGNGNSQNVSKTYGS